VFLREKASYNVFIKMLEGLFDVWGVGFCLKKRVFAGSGDAGLNMVERTGGLASAVSFGALKS
jgi:hypothetical protein